MKVKVVVYSFLKEKLGWKEKTIEIDRDKTTVGDIISLIPDLKKVICENVDEFLILVNGINIRLLKQLKTEVNDGAEIAIFPPGGGG